MSLWQGWVGLSLLNPAKVLIWCMFYLMAQASLCLPPASVQTNNYRSDYFPLTQYTRQGCPLSPLLFSVSVGLLAIALWAYSGIIRAGQEHKVTLYADDLLLYISNPTRSIPAMINILERFGKISTYYLNVIKSMLFLINALEDEQSFNFFPFKVSNQFKYLGVNVTKTFTGMYN